jgi:hypothetical protein
MNDTLIIKVLRKEIIDAYNQENLHLTNVYPIIKRLKIINGKNIKTLTITHFRFVNIYSKDIPNVEQINLLYGEGIRFNGKFNNLKTLFSTWCIFDIPPQVETNNKELEFIVDTVQIKELILNPKLEYMNILLQETDISKIKKQIVWSEHPIVVKLLNNLIKLKVEYKCEFPKNLE